MSWLYADETESEHPADTPAQRVAHEGDVSKGSQWTVSQVHAVVAAGLWPQVAIFITWDDWGGWWDHVTPPEVERWKDVKGGSTVRETLQRIEDIRKYDSPVLLTSVTRVVDQKIRLLFEPGPRKRKAIDDLLPLLSKYNGVYVMLGTGTPEYEEALVTAQRKHPRLLYLKGYSESIADALYASGSLFLMPSLFPAAVMPTFSISSTARSRAACRVEPLWRRCTSVS